MNYHQWIIKFIIMIPALFVFFTVPVNGEDLNELVVTFKEDVSTLDPAIGYDNQNWDIIRSMNSALMILSSKTNTPEPELAETYEISQDGMTYSFTLRKNIKFHNGREVTAQDVKYSLQRTINPKTMSPGAVFYKSIKGFKEMNQGNIRELKSIEVTGTHQLKIRLFAPDATFIHALAINFACIVPKEEVEEKGGLFGKEPVGCGPFKLRKWKDKKRIILEKNPDYFIEGIPGCDRISFELNQVPAVALLKFERGEVDILGDGVPLSRLETTRNLPAYAKRLVEVDVLQTSYMAMNTRIKPLNNQLVRQAINMVINKKKIISILKDTAIGANQILPPRMPGYDKNYTGYEKNPRKAKKLLAAAGYAKGFNTELYAVSLDPFQHIARSIQYDLSLIEINVSLKLLTQEAVIEAAGDPQRAPMVLSCGLGWIADFPDPSNFYDPILGCESAVSGGWNWSFYCNREIEELAKKANTISDPALASARNELWGKIYGMIMEDAPWVPLYHTKRTTLASTRLLGKEHLYKFGGGNIPYWLFSVKK